ncbi:MAG: energy transducer TonB [Rhodocyclaceae bacterium]|nr:energy transducer TonB [Rhodocyclaceae bacterium]
MLGPTAGLAPSQRNLVIALGVSLLIHGLLLTVHFTFPGALDKAKEQALEVILVNSKSARKPSSAQAKAQANLDGGGNTDEDRRVSTPLPVSPQTKEGDDLVSAQKRVTELEAHQQQMMSQLKSQKSVSTDPKRNDPTTPAPNVSGLDLANSALAIARLEGQIAQRTEEYNKRPRKKNIGARTEEYRFAQYVEDWRQKVERVGNLNYPEAAKGKAYGNLVLSVTIKADGSIQQILIDRSSGHKVLDDAARRIVQMASPYSPFTPDIARDTDIIEITRTWTFTSGDRLNTN